MRRPRLLFYNRFPLQDEGGLSFFLACAADLLKDRCQITLALPSRPNLNVVNAKFQSHLNEDDLRIIVVKSESRWMDYWRLCFNCCEPHPVLRREAQCNDLCVSFLNIGYFGKPAIHFVADVYIMDKLGIEKPRYTLWSPPQRGFNNRVRMKIGKWMYFCKRFLKFVSGYHRRLRNAMIKNGDCIVAHSRWIASFFEKAGFPTVLLYPPVTAEFPYVSLADRSVDFVCIGRISNQKRIERMIEILAEVRKRSGREFRFRIAGGLVDQPYSEYVKNLADCYSWITLEGSLFGAEKEKFLTGHRYAIHACEFEAFGIAVAEYLKAGCIPFVPNEGGSAEIVASPELCYADAEDAVEKILNFLEKDEAEQAKVQTQMLERGRLFTLDKFKEDFTALLEEKLAARGFSGVLRG